MPYKAISDLPEHVRKFDQKIQERWLATFNSAWDSWPPKKKRKGGAQNREEYAFAVANSGLPTQEWVEVILADLLVEQDQEKLKAAQAKRAQASGIAPKEGGNLTMPKQFRDLGAPDTNEAWGDHTNYSWPCFDEERALAAKTYWTAGKGTERYSAAEKVKVEGRINRALTRFKYAPIGKETKPKEERK